MGDSIRYLFVVGVGRSGTTWISWLLAQHPRLVVCQHSALFEALRPLRDWWAKPVPLGRRLLHRLQDQHSTTEQRSEAQQFLDRAALDRIAGQLASAALEQLALTRRDASVIVDHTPEHLELADDILAVLPNAGFLHVVRDVRAVFCSWKAAGTSWSNAGDFPASPTICARRWCDYQQRARRLAELGPQFRTVRYEDMLAAGVPTLAAVFRWLGVDDSEDLCRAALEACRIENLAAKGGMPAGFFRRGSAEDWRQEISPSELRVIEYIAGQEMARVGYPTLLSPQSRPPWRLRVADLRDTLVRRALAGPLRPIGARLRARVGSR